MNEVLKTIENRYSCRSFDGVMPPESSLDAIARAAVNAPSALNRRPWRVIVVKDTSLIREMDDEGMAILKAQQDQSAYEKFMGRGGKLLYNAPCMLVIVTESREGYGLMDCGIVAQNITLAASSLGLGSVICGMTGTPLSGKKGGEFKKRLGFPDGYEFAVSVLIGFEDKKGEPNAPALDKISVVG